jgi:hypothetical protein
VGISGRSPPCLVSLTAVISVSSCRRASLESTIVMDCGGGDYEDGVGLSACLGEGCGKF